MRERERFALVIRLVKESSLWSIYGLTSVKKDHLNKDLTDENWEEEVVVREKRVDKLHRKIIVSISNNGIIV